NGFTLTECRFIDIRTKFFTVTVVRHWTMLPREVVGVPPLETFKFKLNWSL
ncbi:hypothetical protein N341_07516, partial [Tyto alba]